MSDDERRDWLNMKRVLERQLMIIDQQILLYSVRGDDEKHQFLLKKAVVHRDSIKKIDEILTDE